MLKKLISMITMMVLSLGAQAQDDKKCPEDPAEFKGKEDDCFDCLEGAFSNLKLFTVEVNKMLDEKKLTTAEQAKSMKPVAMTFGMGLKVGKKFVNKKQNQKQRREQSQKQGREQSQRRE